MRTVVFVLGCPGVGKTTLTRALLGSQTTQQGYWTLGSDYCALGSYHGQRHDGGDTLPRLSGVTVALLRQLDSDLPEGLIALLDGVRFTRLEADTLIGSSHRLGIVLDASLPTLQRRRAHRGSPRMETSWLRTQSDTALRLAKSLDAYTTLDGENPVEDLALQAKVWIGSNTSG